MPANRYRARPSGGVADRTRRSRRRGVHLGHVVGRGLREGAPWLEVTRDDLARACDRLGVALLALDAALPDIPQYPVPDVRAQPDLEEIPEDTNSGELLYVPSRPLRRGQRDAQLELQRFQGKLTLLAYTSPQELEEGCGPHQAWVAIRADRLDAVIAQCGADGVLFNPKLSEQARHTGPVHDWTRSSGAGGQ